MKHNLLMNIYGSRIRHLLFDELSKRYTISDNSIVIETPKNFGDLSIPCFNLAKIMKNSPRDIAEEIKSILTNNEKNLNIKKVDVINGFVNLYFNTPIIKEILSNFSFASFAIPMM